MRQLPRYITNTSPGQNPMGARPRNHSSPVSEKMGSPLSTSTQTRLEANPLSLAVYNKLINIYTKSTNPGYTMNWEKESLGKCGESCTIKAGLRWWNIVFP